MSLYISDLTFRNFRSYETFHLEDIGKLSIFVGSNAIGKTNIVEGIQLMTALTSFRHATIEQLIRRGASTAELSMNIGDECRQLDISLLIDEHSKHYALNGKTKKVSDLKGLIPSVTFTPDDLNLIKGSPSIRRRALDALGSQLHANYHCIQKDYEKVLQHKNRLLKEGTSYALLDSINETMITCGAQLCCYRAALFEKLVPYIKSCYEQIANKDPNEKEMLEIRFVPFWQRGSTDCNNIPTGGFDRDKACRAFASKLETQRSEEISRQRALVGPHFDEIHFEINGLSASDYASQGQQRSIVLAYKLAEAAIIEDMLDQKPVLLFDDVMSELDADRRTALITYISRDVQTFITTANLAYFDDEMLSAATIVNLPLA